VDKWQPLNIFQVADPNQISVIFLFSQGRVAKKHKGSKDFNRRSAEESFRSLVKTHEKYGWVTPPLADG
jgi:ubiquitin-conjugating enzyme E2 Q